jgi:hypothetical protein
MMVAGAKQPALLNWRRQSVPDSPTRFALIEFDPHQLAQLDLQAEGYVFASLIKRGLLGEPHARERGILRITPVAPPLVVPEAGIDGEMTVG